MTKTIDFVLGLIFLSRKRSAGVVSTLSKTSEKIWNVQGNPLALFD
jgi:hypothetical protein